MPSAVVARGLAVHYGRRPALEDVDLDLPAGAVTSLIGPNGSGKSTLLSVIAGLLEPTTGMLERLGASSPDASRLACVLQGTADNALLPLTVREIVAMGRYARLGLLRRFRAQDHDAVESALARLELADVSRRQLRELSAGQRQRVLVAQGLAQQGELLLLDEPVTGLDLASRRRILDTVAEERDAGRTVVMATHDLRDAGESDHVVLLATRVIAAGTPAEVLCDEALGVAYGGRLVRVGGAAAVDDEHDHGDGATSRARAS